MLIYPIALLTTFADYNRIHVAQNESEEVIPTKKKHSISYLQNVNGYYQTDTQFFPCEIQMCEWRETTEFI